jgi:hypothetical protein
VGALLDPVIVSNIDIVVDSEVIGFDRSISDHKATERIYIEIPVFSAHLYRPFRVPSAMCPRFLVAKLTYPMPINRWL